MDSVEIASLFHTSSNQDASSKGCYKSIHAVHQAASPLDDSVLLGSVVERPSGSVFGVRWVSSRAHDASAHDQAVVQTSEYVGGPLQLSSENQCINPDMRYENPLRYI